MVVLGWADETCKNLYITRYLIMLKGYPYKYSVNIGYPMLSYYFNGLSQFKTNLNGISWDIPTFGISLDLFGITGVIP